MGRYRIDRRAGCHVPYGYFGNSDCILLLVAHRVLCSDHVPPVDAVELAAGIINVSRGSGGYAVYIGSSVPGSKLVVGPVDVVQDNVIVPGAVIGREYPVQLVILGANARFTALDVDVVPEDAVCRHGIVVILLEFDVNRSGYRIHRAYVKRSVLCP